MSSSHSGEAELEVALVGYGLAGRVFHAPFLRDHPRMRIGTIVTGSPERAAAARRENPSARIVAGVEDIGDDARLVVVATPPARHLEQVLAVLRPGRAVLVDKPFMPDAAAADRAIREADRVGSALCVYHNRRWDGDFRTLRALLEEGALGEVYEFESTFEHWDPTPQRDWKLLDAVSRGGGVTMDLGSHLVDQAIRLFGEPIETWADPRMIRAGSGNDDVSLVRLIHPGGVRSTLRMSRLAAQPLPRFRVSGRERSAVVRGLDPQEPLLDAGMPVAELRDAQLREPRFVELGPSASGEAAERRELEPGDYRAFYDAIARWALGEAAAPVSMESALATLRTLEQATARLRAGATENGAKGTGKADPR